MITFREIFRKYLKICREYSLNMAEAADFSMPDAFAKDYLDRIIKKTEKSLNNTCILYTFVQDEKQNLVTLVLMCDCLDTRVLYQ
jgi:hypothetical protein